MNEASRWRFELAQHLAPLYSQHANVALVEVGGSVSRNCADRFSDTELGIFWSEPPAEEDRTRVIEQAGGVLWHLFPYDREKQQWAEDYYMRGVKIDVSHYTVESVEQILSAVIDHYEPSLEKQQLISALQYALPLYGSSLLVQWQEKAKAYPDKLTQAMVQAHLHFSPRWGAEMLAERGDLLLLYEQFCTVEKNLLCVLMGLNRIYHPGWKWMDRLIEEMPVAPPRLAPRLKQSFRLEPCAGIAQLQTLVDELFLLVETHMSSIDTTAARSWFAHRRKLWDQAPEGLFHGI